MQIRVSRKPGTGLKEKTFRVGGRRFNLYLSPGLDLPHGGFLLFDGHIDNYAGKEQSFFTPILNKGSFRELLEYSQEWEGAWAIVYISECGNCYCITDPLGIKQLYYNSEGDICSSAKDIANSSPIDDVYKSTISKWGYNYDNRTPWLQVKRIMPNEMVGFMGNEIFNRKEQYYNWDVFAPGTPNTGDIRLQIHYAVEANLRGIPEWMKSIGVLLSGGLDSSIISYELIDLYKSNKLKGKELKFYTINNEEDAPFVKIFSDAFNIKTTTLSYDMESADLLSALRINETPVDLGSMVPNQLMFKAIPEGVIFTGDGADELFGGYRRIDEYDSQKSDVFQELSFYHLPRLERAATFFGKTLRTPFLSQHVVKTALNLPFEQRKHKLCLKQVYADVLPKEIIERPKLPLKNADLRKDPLSYRYRLIDLFYSNLV